MSVCPSDQAAPRLLCLIDAPAPPFTAAARHEDANAKMQMLRWRLVDSLEPDREPSSCLLGASLAGRTVEKTSFAEDPGRGLHLDALHCSRYSALTPALSQQHLPLTYPLSLDILSAEKHGRQPETCNLIGDLDPSPPHVSGETAAPMAFPRNSLRAFLSHAKTSLRTAVRQKQNVTLVIGNESADLDSMTCSLLYAYVRSQAPPKDAFTPLYVPIVNISANDISLRPEFIALFRHANISAAHLITLDDLPIASQYKQLLPPEKTRWILVDHNNLQGFLGQVYSTRVHGTIDHHDEEGTVPKETNPEPRCIEKCGSCTSLVVRFLQPFWDALSSSALSSGAGHAQGDSLIDDSAVIRGWDAQVAKLALASILIDTRDLQDKDKTKDVDREAVTYLESRIKLSPKEARTWDRSAFFKEIDGAEQNIESLTLYDILRKDYKQWNESNCKLGISSVVKPLDFLVNKAGNESGPGAEEAFHKTLEEFMAARSLGLFAVMTTFASPEGKFQRQLLVTSRKDIREAVFQFESSNGEELRLESIPAGTNIDDKAHKGNEESGLSSRSWIQQNVSMSRKQVAPMLRKVLQT
ncbi:Exopolyphosphatase [Xylographa soralifera]|nr:Exopolyphosphatase [Xylographa soralifera]